MAQSEMDYALDQLQQTIAHVEGAHGHSIELQGAVDGVYERITPNDESIDDDMTEACDMANKLEADISEAYDTMHELAKTLEAIKAKQAKIKA